MMGQKGEIFFIVSSFDKFNEGYMCEGYSKDDNLVKLFADEDMPVRYRSHFEEGKSVVICKSRMGGKGVMQHRYLHKGSKVFPARSTPANITPVLLESYHKPQTFSLQAIKEMDMGKRVSIEVTLEEIYPVITSTNWRRRAVFASQAGLRMCLTFWDRNAELVTEEMKGTSVCLINMETDRYNNTVQLRSVQKTRLTVKKRTEINTASVDSSSEIAKKKDHFKTQMSKYVVKYLNPYRKPECKLGKITSTDDFKHLARKLTHAVLDKELKYCRHVEDLEVNKNVKSKAKEFVKKYMSRCGSIYRSRR